MSALEQFAAYVAGGAPAANGAAASQAASLHVADTVGAWIAGSRTAEGKALIRFLSSPGHLCQSAMGALDRVVLNCAVTRLSEIDDIHLASTTTPGAVIVPAALTLASVLPDVRANALKESILAGYEAIVRLGLALNGPTILYRGIWPTYFAAAFGVATVASRLLALNELQCANALAMALNMTPPGVAHQAGPRMSRWLLFGYAARHGGMAALGARAGFTADVNLLERDFFSTVYGITPRATAFTDGLGQGAAISEVSFKPWCAARQTISATQAVREIAHSGVSASAIESIRIYVPPPYLKMINHGVVKGDRSTHLTSAPYQVALALTSPEASYGVEHSPEQIPAEVHALMDKVTVEADDALLSHFPRAWPARVEVRTASQRHEKLMLHAPGDPERPFGEAEVTDKFRRVVAPLLGAQGAAEWAARGLRAAADASAAPLVAELEASYLRA